MSKTRQKAPLAPRGVKGADISSRKNNYSSYFFLSEHYHEEAQLLFATHGIMTVYVGSQLYVVPPSEAVWIPPYVAHSIQMSKNVRMRTLYFRSKLAKKMPKEFLVLSVSPFLKELILYSCELETLKSASREQDALIKVLIDQINKAQSVSLNLVMPSEERGEKVARIILAEPGSEEALKKILEEIGTSKRTIERIFVAETGMSLGRWRQQARLLHGVKLITEGVSITEAAFESGYSSPSAFTVMFKRALGMSPKQLKIVRPE